MKILRNLLFITFFSLILTSCGGNAPEAIVEKYIKALRNVDFKAAKECLTKSLAQEFEEMIKDIDEDEIKDLKKENANLNIKITRSEINGESAVVYFEEEHGDHSHERQIPLKKEEGEWKISNI